jgi:7-cyano-7-deazaguanine synthase
LRVMRSVLLFSGGMDSYAARMLYEPDVLLYVDAGTRYADAELRRLPEETIVVDMRVLNTFGVVDDIIPLRNLFFVAVAAQYGEQIILGATAGDRVLDKSAEFATQTSALLSYLWQKQHWTEGKTIEVAMPMKGMSKTQIIAAVQNKCGDSGVAQLAKSFSCYNPNNDIECGVCKPCRRKWIAFASLGFAHLVVDARHAVLRNEYQAIEFGTWDRGRDELIAVTTAIESTA